MALCFSASVMQSHSQSENNDYAFLFTYARSLVNLASIIFSETPHIHDELLIRFGELKEAINDRNKWENSVLQAFHISIHNSYLKVQGRP